MNTIESVDLTQSAKDAVLYANTPSYLLEKLKRDAAVQNLVHKNPPSELLDLLSRLAPASNVLEIARKYVLLVALATSSLPDKWDSLSALDLSDLEWGKLILRIAQAQDVPTHQAYVVADDTGNRNDFKWNQPEMAGR
jgi:hypothetical protein